MYKIAKYVLPALVGLFFVGKAQAIDISGVVLDKRTGEPLIAATVLITPASDSTQRRYVTTDYDGVFTMPGLAAETYRFDFEYLGYKKISQTHKLAKNKNFGKIRLMPDAVELDAVRVVGVSSRASQRGDTTDFLAEAYKVTQDASTEDLIKKMPGITIEGNEIKTQGETVTKVLVDGKPFFGDDPSVAIKNLPAEVIAKIETYTKLSEQAQLTGVDDGEGERTINIVTRPDRRMGQFGRMYAGLGYDDKNDLLRYSAGGNLNLFNKTRRISIVGMSNNVNQQSFSSEDLAGMGGSGGRGGGRYASANSGIATTHSIGLNYSESFGTKLDLTGSYFLNMSDNDNESSSERTYIAGDNADTYRSQWQKSNSETYNHRLNLKLDYQITERTSLLIQPSLRFTNNSSGRESVTSMRTISDMLSESNNESGSEQSRFNMHSEALLRHKFVKPGRTLSLSVRMDADNGNTDSYQKALTTRATEHGDSISNRNQESENPVTNWSTRTRLLYTEPLGRFGLVQVGYSLSLDPSRSNKHTYNFDSIQQAFDYDNPDSLYSSIYNNDYTKHRAEVAYRLKTEKMNASAGVDYEYASLNGRQVLPAKPDVKKAFNMLLPNARVEYKFTKYKTLRAFYRTRTNAPSIAQLQSVLDNSNDLLIRSGNPNLRQTFNQTLAFNYNQTSLEEGTTFFAQLWGTTISNSIAGYTMTNSSPRDTVITDENTGNQVTLEPGSQYSTYRNMNGYYSLRTSATVGFPLNQIKCNLNLTGALGFSRQPGFANGEKNVAYTTSPTGGATLSSNISEKIDFTVSYRATYNFVKNTLETSVNNNYFRHGASLSGTWITWNDITLRGSANYDQNLGLSEGYNQEYLRIDASVGKKFLKNKNAELRLAVYDLLNQSKNYNRNITAEYIEDVSSQVLSRYFMLSFVYTLRSFGTPPSREGREGGRGGFGGHGGGGFRH
ncbi:MAG: TonB-dependent receptor [Prevotellaceae bacterium]|jgi:hypothetical protein|nr:TonB-dependent receptor [Prevotellaceae bacterium]